MSEDQRINSKFLKKPIMYLKIKSPGIQTGDAEKKKVLPYLYCFLLDDTDMDMNSVLILN